MEATEIDSVRVIDGELIEMRAVSKHRVERRDEGAPPVLRGYASVFDFSYRIGDWFEEVIRPGAFTRAIEEGQDVRALWNHDSSEVLGRTASGTLEIGEDEIGLAFELEPPRSAEARIEAIERGDVSEMSFAFTPRREIWTERDGDIPLREILDVDLYEISPVTWPASSATSVEISARSKDGGAQEALQRYLDLRTHRALEGAEGSSHRLEILRARIEIERERI